MPKITIEITNNLNLAISLLCEIQGISKSQFLRMAALEFASEIILLGSVSNINKTYLIALLKLAITEASDKELSPQFKQVFSAQLDRLGKLENS